MDENSKLYPSKIKSQCYNARIRLDYDITSLRAVREEIDQFVNDTYIKSESFDKLKLQCSNYLDVLDKMVSINQADIADYIILENAMDAVAEDLIGEVIIASKKRFMFLRNRAYEMERYYLLMAMCSWLLPALVSYYNDIAKMYRKMAEFFNSKYLEYLKKEELYDKVETETAGLFSSSSAERNRVSALLSGLLSFFTIEDYIGGNYNVEVINNLRKNLGLPLIMDSTNKTAILISYDDMYDALSDVNKEFVDKIVAFEHERIDSTKRETLKCASIQLLYEDFEPAFVIGMLANIVYEGNVGQLEVINKPTKGYKKIMVDQFNYDSEYSGKNVKDIGVESIKTLEDRIAEYNQNLNNDETKAKYGLGMMQHTFPTRRSHLVECYEEFVDAYELREYQYEYAEIELAVRELTGYYEDDYIDIYPKWKSSNDNSKMSVENAARVICTRFEIPADKEVQADIRAELAGGMYEHIYD